MSQKKEKYARELGRIQRMQGVKLRELDKRVAQFEKWEWCWLDTREVKRLRERVSMLEREQRRREVSRDRIVFVSATFAVCAALIWISLKIFRLI